MGNVFRPRQAPQWNVVFGALLDGLLLWSNEVAFVDQSRTHRTDWAAASSRE